MGTPDPSTNAHKNERTIRKPTVTITPQCWNWTKIARGRNASRGRKPGSLGTEVPQRGSGAKPRWEPVVKAPGSWSKNSNKSANLR